MHPDFAPSPWIVRYLRLIRAGGRVLDLAAGNGRHTQALRAKGFQVVAVDRDSAELRARFAGDPSCVVLEMDLEDGGGPWRLGGDYDGIVVANYLHRPLLPYLAAALAPGGALIYDTFMTGNERFGKPANPAFLLRPGELRTVFAKTLTIIDFAQGIVALPRPAAMQRLAAVKEK